ncbi:MAG: UDP-N-acetylmuramoyl-tripeptide--D-alanyl-D-alanine ligase [Candidatus Aenigmatarchaeota archaeon]|nr:MAG: UDP-N-acetylmuramoyl-tripeptide--D-alanyl-D-alanine ligase [Candidatus Aenigmarchaeota archaeon]
MLKAKEVSEAVSGYIIRGDPETLFCSVSTDSRNIKGGELFFALKGERHDGHLFIDDARRKGAKGAVINESMKDVVKGDDFVVIAVKDTLKALGDLSGWWRRRFDVKVIGITGSSGKTTTKEMLSKILSAEKNVLKSPGNYNNLIGLPLTLLNLRRFHEIAIVEMGMNRIGEIRRLTEIARPEIGIITNVGPAHLEGVGDIRGVLKAKTELIEEISEDGVVFINGDSELLSKEAERFGKNVIRFGKGSQNDVRIIEYKEDVFYGSSFSFLWKGKRYSFQLSVPGFFNIMNAVAASAVAIYLGMSEDVIKRKLKEYREVEGRFQRIYLKEDVLLINDTYNANPLSLNEALSFLKQIRSGRQLIIGLGDMLELGDYTEKAHREAGREVAKLKPDFFFAIGNFARYMIEGARDEGFKNVFLCSDHEEMAELIKKHLKKGSVVFLKASRRICLENVVKKIKEEWDEEDRNC